MCVYQFMGVALVIINNYLVLNRKIDDRKGNKIYDVGRRQAALDAG